MGGRIRLELVAESSQEWAAQWTGIRSLAIILYHAIWHELGHLMFFRKASTVYWKNPSLTQPEAAIAVQVSLYAEQSVREFVAETFAALLAGRTLPADVLNLYQQYGGTLP